VQTTACGLFVAVKADFQFLSEVIQAGLVRGPVLEIGGRSWQGSAGNAKATCTDHGLQWEAADIESGPDVSIVVDILDPDAVARIERRWPTILVFNLLEHVYDPIAALRNSVHLLEPGGSCVIAGPALWQLHDFPADYWRPLPDFFSEFARRESLTLVVTQMKWLVFGKTIPVSEMTSSEGQKLLPSTSEPQASRLWGYRKATLSRAVHKLFRTYGRETSFPFVGLGVVLQKPHRRTD
jgi:SAM-dependent methyltransferase